MSQPALKELEVTLRTAVRSVLLNHGTPVTQLLNVVRSEALRASAALPPRHVIYNTRYGGGFALSPLAEHLLWRKKVDKGTLVEEKYRSGPYTYPADRDDPDFFQVVRDIGAHFTYGRTSQGDPIISNTFKEYYIAEVLQSDDQKLSHLNDPEAAGWVVARKRRRDDPIPSFNGKDDGDVPSVSRSENPDVIELYNQILPSVRNIASFNFFFGMFRANQDEYNRAVFRQAWKLGRDCIVEAFPQIFNLVPYLKEDGGEWPARVEDLGHPGDVERAILAMGLRGAGEPVYQIDLKIKEIPAFADFEIDGHEGKERVFVDSELERFTLDPQRMNNTVAGAAGNDDIDTLKKRRVIKTTPLSFFWQDDFHPESNKNKMANGIPLTDEDRKPWLTAIRDALRNLESEDPTRRIVVACSALKRSYRDTLRDKEYHMKNGRHPPGAIPVQFVYLKGSEPLLKERIGGRHAHFMKANMLTSQLATLEEPDPEKEEGVVWVGIDQPKENVVKEAMEKLGLK
ncbi:hypothetical protein HK104_002441 [Borealophlyctis nickersoniae]|nr:hypothetical protein HK104_002441 [Borealophlyctis nickersoniae]